MIYFDDLSMNQRLDCPPSRTASAGDQGLFAALTGLVDARALDGAWIHPSHVLALVHGQVHSALGTIGRQELGIAKLVVHRRVAAGERLRSAARVFGLKEDANRNSGVVWLRVSTRDSRGVVLSFVIWLRLPKRSERRTPYYSRPEKPHGDLEVGTRDLSLLDLGEPPEAKDTGSTQRFGDLSVGDTWVPDTGCVIGAASARQFARWSGLKTGRWLGPTPVLSGAHVLCASLAMAGEVLPNRLGLAGLNAMTWPAPVEPDAVLRVHLRVVDLVDLGRVGAVRLRLWAHKDFAPVAGDASQRVASGAYQPHVVLDADLWELLAV